MVVAVTMFASPLMVAGIVIGLILFLSLLIIIIGSLRKKKLSHLNTDTADEHSFGGSIGELRSECVDEFPSAFDLDPYLEPVSNPHFSTVYPDAPPHYDECVGRDATQIFTPTDDPPPYSHTSHTHPYTEGVELPEGMSFWSPHRHAACDYPISTEDPTSVFAVPVDDPPTYEAVMEQQNRTIPLISTGPFKHTAE